MSAVNRVFVFVILTALVMNGAVWAMPIVEDHETDAAGLLLADHDRQGAASTDEDCHHFCHAGAHSLAFAVRTLNYQSVACAEPPLASPWAPHSVSRKPPVPPPYPVSDPLS